MVIHTKLFYPRPLSPDNASDPRFSKQLPKERTVHILFIQRALRKSISWVAN